MFGPILVTLFLAVISKLHFTNQSFPKAAIVCVSLLLICLIIQRIPFILTLASLSFSIIFLLDPLQTYIYKNVNPDQLRLAGFITIVLSAHLQSFFPLHTLRRKIAEKLTLGSTPTSICLRLIMKNPLPLLLQLSILILIGSQLPEIIEILRNQVSLQTSIPMLNSDGLTLCILAYLCVLRKGVL